MIYDVFLVNLVVVVDGNIMLVVYFSVFIIGVGMMMNVDNFYLLLLFIYLVFNIGVVVV